MASACFARGARGLEAADYAHRPALGAVSMASSALPLICPSAGDSVHFLRDVAARERLLGRKIAARKI